MSKGGGAGKVYFVLYLAVVLELLIIIVERDEAEEHLHKKQKEAMRIVESILTQMQSGAGTEGMNTRPQDEITIPPAGVNIQEIMGADIKSWREYIIEVGVTDITSAIQKRELETETDYMLRLEKLVQLANVEQIQYQIFYNPDTNPDNAPIFPSDEFLIRYDFLQLDPNTRLVPENEGDFDSGWEFMGLRELNLDLNATFRTLDLENLSARSMNPVYPAETIRVVGADFAPPEIANDSIFYYSRFESTEGSTSVLGSELQKRAFKVYFQPPGQAGWYKLRFSSRTNRILGVRAGQKSADISDEATVNIGTVQLSVGNLRQVQRELQISLDKYDIPDWLQFLEDSEDRGFDAIIEFNKAISDAKMKAATEDKADEVVSRIDLYSYIAKLLAPGQSSNFDQNRGNIEFNIRVITPQPKLADPIISVTNYVATFDKVPAVFQFDISPYQDANVVEGRVKDMTGATVARLDLRPLDQIAGMNVSAPVTGQAREYRATVEKELAPGKYDVEITHQLMGKVGTGRAQLEVFPTGLTEESERDINNRLNSFAYYGYPLVFNAIPTSGGKIKSDQFIMYVNTDDDRQRAPYNSLNISNEDAIRLSPSSKEVSVRVAWVQPYTNTEVDLLPVQNFEIRQEEPNISDRTMSVDISGTANRLVVNIDNLVAIKPQTGSDQEARVQLSVAGEPQIVDGLTGYQVAVEPSISDLGEGNYSVYFELAGQLERGQTRVSGVIRLVLRAVAINPVNGAVSAPTDRIINVQIDHSPERAGPQRRR